MWQIAIVFACIIGIIGTISGYLKDRDARVETNFAVRVEKQAEKNDAKAQTARTAATAKPDGVLSRYCRDCGQSGSVQIMEAGHSVAK
jgi:hypothetical protein